MTKFECVHKHLMVVMYMIRSLGNIRECDCVHSTGNYIKNST